MADRFANLGAVAPFAVTEADRAAIAAAIDEDEIVQIDLSSPQHARLSISEICFRWGFNGSAHFSRAFREQYGLSPREFRQGREPAGLSPGRALEQPHM